jgi:hypothetical protein
MIDDGCTVEATSRTSRAPWCSATYSAAAADLGPREARAERGADGAKVGAACESVDAAARKVITDFGFGPDIRCPACLTAPVTASDSDGHEWTNLVRGNKTKLEPGMCFSDEPMVADLRRVRHTPGRLFLYDAGWSAHLQHPARVFDSPLANEPIRAATVRSARSTNNDAILSPYFTLRPWQPSRYFTDIFPPEEYAARRVRVMAKIGDAVAIIQGTTERPAEQAAAPGQSVLLSHGRVEPRAILVIDGQTHRSRLFLNPRNERRETMITALACIPASRRKGRQVSRPYRCDRSFSGVGGGPRRRPRDLYAAPSWRYSGARRPAIRQPGAEHKADPWDGRISPRRLSYST